jgi:POLQ-like helicase
MLIGETSDFLLKQTRSKAKMYEYNVPTELHIPIKKDVNELMLLAIALLGDISVAISEGIEDKEINTLKNQLKFASRYFDSYYNSHLYENDNEYLLLLASASYYFGEYHGSSIVLAKRINLASIDLQANGLEKMLAWLLQNNYNVEILLSNKDQNNIIQLVKKYFLLGLDFDSLELQNFRENMYDYGTARELFFADIIVALILSKMNNSLLKLLPQYTDIDREKWKSVMLTTNFIKELWPAQKRLGMNDIYRGRSAVIQLPTSAGKTKAVSLIIQSAFLANRSRLIIIVAPFRALCREISTDLSKDFYADKSITINEISDVLQFDEQTIELLGLEELLNQKTILVVTPEKLIYLFRQCPELIHSIGVLIFDEGHLFDDPSRGAVYELLVSTIISYVKSDIQKILISAVISNAEQINEWLNGDNGTVISSNSIQASEKSIAYFDWRTVGKTEYGYLYFIDPLNNSKEEFYVPRVVEIVKLNRLPRERSDRYFPDVNFSKQDTKGGDISICLSEKLCSNGGVAIFCGTKSAVNKILSRFLDIEDRGYKINSIKQVCNQEELVRLSNLIFKNYGSENEYYKCAQRGIFAHHANIANGIKVSAEYAMKERLIKLVVCTSTLAQGVNLPIKYLLISSAFQAGEKMKVRDFHNLIGRTGRSGFYTEGSIILTEDFVYNDRSHNWKYREYNNLLDASKSENCISTLLSTVRDIKINYGKGTLNSEFVINEYYNGEDVFNACIDQIKEQIKKISGVNERNRVEKDVWKSIDNLKCILHSLESFILSITPKDETVTNGELTEIVRSTLAYYLATEDEKEKLVSLFIFINDNILKIVKDTSKRLVLGKTLLGINQSIEIDSWVFEHFEELEFATDTKELLQIIFPIIMKVNGYKKLARYGNIQELLQVMMMWINGESFERILKYMNDNDIKIYKRGSYRDVMIDNVVELCESCFGYQCSLILSALSEMVKNVLNSSDKFEMLNEIARSLKYGLADETAILIYEMGFSDRIVSQEIFSTIPFAKDKRDLKRLLKNNSQRVYELLNPYPSYFSVTLAQIIGR